MKRLLVVDDEPDVAEVLGELLIPTYAVTLAHDGAEALRILEAGGIDAVVLDLMMPVMSGEALMGELRARKIAVPVIFASAADDLAERASRSRASDFIAKPFDLAELEEKLARLLGPAGTGGTSEPEGTGASRGLPEPPPDRGASSLRSEPPDADRRPPCPGPALPRRLPAGAPALAKTRRAAVAPEDSSPPIAPWCAALLAMDGRAAAGPAAARGRAAASR
jgi:CheY-like chemotaxis protein